MYNLYFYIILWFYFLFFIIDRVLDFLNIKNWDTNLPDDAKDIFNIDEYKKSQEYQKAKYKFSKISSTFSFIVTIFVLIFFLFWKLDIYLRWFIENEFLLTITFFWIIFFIQVIISLPFSYYMNFVIEEKFGFNRMTKKLFFIDTIKSILLSLIIWGILLFIIVWFYNIFWSNFWIFAWVFLSIFSIFMMMFYSSLIVPFFNKQTPLEDWELKDAINDFVNKVWFKLDNIYVIDWSKRSTKSNAYFSWFWAKKRIVLYDTLIKDLTTKELVAVLAHEIGHYKKKHNLGMLLFSIFQTGVMLFIFSLFIENIEVAKALWASQVSFHIGLLAFMFLFSPISFVFWILLSIYSRKNEYEADQYVKLNYDSKELISALKKLSKNNLTNLTPHPLYEFVYYSHPTVLKRIRALK